MDAPSGRRELPAGSYVLGRSGDCDIVLENGRASRRHARIVVSDTGATIEDLGSANGTFINGARITGDAAPLAPDAFIVIGDVGLEIAILPHDARRPLSQPFSKPTGTFESQPPPTKRSTVQEVLTSAADFALRSGQPEMAERTLDAWLITLLSEARSGEIVAEEDREGAERYAVELAMALGSARWVDFVLELATATKTPIADDRGRLLSSIIDRVGVPSTVLEAYLAMLEALPERARGRRSVERAIAWRESAVDSR